MSVDENKVNLLLDDGKVRAVLLEPPFGYKIIQCGGDKSEEQDDFEEPEDLFPAHKNRSSHRVALRPIVDGKVDVFNVADTWAPASKLEVLVSEYEAKTGKKCNAFLMIEGLLLMSGFSTLMKLFYALDGTYKQLPDHLVVTRKLCFVVSFPTG